MMRMPEKKSSEKTNLITLNSLITFYMFYYLFIIPASLFITKITHYKFNYTQSSSYRIFYIKK